MSDRNITSRRLEARAECSAGPRGHSVRRSSDYIWLAYSAFFFIDPILRHNTRFWIECGAMYTVFLAVYFSYVNARLARTRYWLLGALCVLGVAGYPFNTGSLSFFIYAAAFMPFALKQVSVARVLLILESLVLVGEGYLMHTRGSLINAAAGVFFIVVVGSANIQIAEQKRADSLLRLAHEEIEQLAALAERERIARDLHDVLGHTLSVIVLKAELAGRLLQVTGDAERASREIAEVERTARTALAEVREAIGGYRAKGLAAELELARNTLHAAGVSLSCETPVPRLAAAEETVLSLALREAVTNIVRHARAGLCTVAFRLTQDGLDTLRIVDDGVGLDGATVALAGGNGLRGMRERVEAMGGRFAVISSGAGQGTALEVSLPRTGGEAASLTEPEKLVQA